jgi:hypothetical protein
MGMILFLIVSVVVNPGDDLTYSIQDIEETLLIVMVIICLGGITLGKLIPRALIQKIKIEADVTEKLKVYISAFILKLAMLEVPTLLAIVFFFIEGNLIYVAIAALMIVIFMFNRPTLYKISNELQLNHQERMTLNNLDSAV